jgi:hypothetical protein
MPGNDFVRKQNVLGSAAGIALLAFALAYRFLPLFGGGNSGMEKPAPSIPSGAPMSVQAPSKEPRRQHPSKRRSRRWHRLLLEPAAAPPPPKAIAALLRKANKAFADGHLIEPRDTSALAQYQKFSTATRTMPRPRRSRKSIRRCSTGPRRPSTGMTTTNRARDRCAGQPAKFKASELSVAGAAEVVAADQSAAGALRTC